MRILIILLAMISIGFTHPVALAKPPQAKQIILYAEPSENSKIIAKIDPWQRLVPIYKKNGWMKVGDPSNGQVGWINIEQYHKLITDLYSCCRENDLTPNKPVFKFC